MFVQIVAFIDGAHHLLLTVIDGGDGQFAERRFVRLAPKDVALFLQLPVAEGDDDVAELQTLRLVDGDEADAVDLVALDSFGAERLFPLADEGVDACGILADVGCQLVVEGADIGTLTLDALKVEDLIQSLHEFVEGERQQLSEVADVGFRQQVVEGTAAQ